MFEGFPASFILSSKEKISHQSSHEPDALDSRTQMQESREYVSPEKARRRDPCRSFACAVQVRHLLPSFKFDPNLNNLQSCINRIPVHNKSLDPDQMCAFELEEFQRCCSSMKSQPSEACGSLSFGKKV